MSAGETATPVPTVTATPLFQRLPDSQMAHAAERCQAAFERAASAFVSSKLTTLAKCTGPILRCVQSGRGPTCLEKAGGRCRDRLARLARARTKLDASIVRACGQAPLAFADLMSDQGLGYGARTDTCRTRFDVELTDLHSIVACVARQHGCVAEEIFQQHAPRTKELLRIANVGDAALATLPCLDDLGGNGEGVSGSAAARAVLRCDAALTSIGAQVASQQLRTLDLCVDAAFTCVQTRPGDGNCVAKAGAKCRKRLARLAGNVEKARLALESRCGDAAMYQLLRSPAGLNLGAAGSSCAALGHPDPASAADYVACALREHECKARDLIQYEVPRAGDLLGLLGLTLAATPCS